MEKGNAGKPVTHHVEHDGEHVGGAGSADEDDEDDQGMFYDKTKSFFDNISCEASERAKGLVASSSTVRYRIGTGGLPNCPGSDRGPVYASIATKTQVVPCL